MMLFCQNIFGQIYLSLDENSTEEGQQISKINTADMDNDGLIDTLFYDFQKQSITVLLSSRNYTPMLIEWTPDFWWESCVLGFYGGGIAISYHHMRTDGTISYAYEKESNRFRLTAIEESHHESRGYSDIFYDLLTHTFTADWSYTDMELAEISNDYLISIPTVKVNLFNPPVYIDDDSIYDGDMRVEHLRIFYQNKSMVDTRMNVIAKEMLLKTEIPVLISSKLSNYSIEKLIEEKNISMNYDKETYQFTVSDTDLYNNNSYGYIANIAALPPYKQYKLFLLSFNFEYGSSAIVMYMLNKDGKCSDTVSFWYDKEKGESIYFMIDSNYEIVIKKGNELAKYFIDKLNCKFVNK